MTDTTLPFHAETVDDVEPAWLPALEAAEADMAAGRVTRVEGENAFDALLDERTAGRPGARSE
jgi:hypothetical protein